MCAAIIPPRRPDDSRSIDMNSWEEDSHLTRGFLQRERAAKAPVRTRLDYCLVVSTARERRDLLSRAATKAGWDTIVCADPPNAIAMARRYRFQMAWVDLNHYGSTLSEFRDLCQSLVGTPGLLLAICGHAGDVEEEIWARQLGVWLYVPGLSTAPAEELSLLCAQARQTATAFQGARGTQRATGQRER